MDAPRVSRTRIGFYVFLAAGILAAVLFVPAGRLDWWPGWAYLALIAITTTVSSVLVVRRDPELAHRRMSIGEGTRPWDRVIFGLIKATFMGAIVLGAWDSGRHGADLPAWLWPIGGAMLIAGTWILTASMLTNTHFESTVRIQADRDHRVIDTGPYAIVRHPGYAGFILVLLATPLLLGSVATLIPIAATVAVLKVRIVLEERLLRRELPGYEEYTKRVRYRLVPGIW